MDYDNSEKRDYLLSAIPNIVFVMIVLLLGLVVIRPVRSQERAINYGINARVYYASKYNADSTKPVISEIEGRDKFIRTVDCAYVNVEKITKINNKKE